MEKTEKTYILMHIFGCESFVYAFYAFKIHMEQVFGDVLDMNA